MERLIIQRAFDYVSAHTHQLHVTNRSAHWLMHQKENIVWYKRIMQMQSTSTVTGIRPNMITLFQFIMTKSFVTLLHNYLQTMTIILQVSEVQKCWNCHFLQSMNVTDLYIGLTQTFMAMVHTMIGDKTLKFPHRAAAHKSRRRISNKSGDQNWAAKSVLATQQSTTKCRGFSTGPKGNCGTEPTLLPLQS
jgi:hypothetical protein